MSYQFVRLFLTSGRSFINLKRNIHFCRILSASHYDTLNLPRNCTGKEVRESFIKLSKQCHPDRNRGDPDTHAKFVKLNEAYSVLSRPDKRRAYDLTLRPLSSERYHRPPEGSPFDVYTTAYRQKVVWRDESFWEYKDKNSHGDFSQSDGYYGIKGVKRVPNGWIAIMCFAFAAFGVWLQVLLIRHSSTFNRQALDERSQEASKMLSDVQEKAQRHGNKVQLELLRRRLDVSQNTSRSFNTITTSVPEDKDNLTTESKNSYPFDTDGSSTITVTDANYYSRANLGYLGDMPHKIRNEVQIVPDETPLNPELHNIARNKSIDNHDILPKPILYDTLKSGNVDDINEQISGKIQLSKIVNDMCENNNEAATEQNLPELIFYDKSVNIGEENKQIEII